MEESAAPGGLPAGSQIDDDDDDSIEERDIDESEDLRSRKVPFRAFFKRNPRLCLELIREVSVIKPFRFGGVCTGWQSVADRLNMKRDLFPLLKDGTNPCTDKNCSGHHDGPEVGCEDFDFTEWNHLMREIHNERTSNKTYSEEDNESKRRKLTDSSNDSVATSYAGAPFNGSTATVDMRSDTVTKPTNEMRQAMLECDVGDDVIGDDPTIHQLESLAAQMFDKEAALYVPSGTMGNLISIMVHCERRGSEILIGHLNHIIIYEQGGVSTIAGVHPRQLRTETEHDKPTPVGGIALTDIEDAVRTDDVHFPISRLVCLENTHNLCGGVALPVEYVDAVADLCQRKEMQLHMDGARIFNAATALGVSVARLCRGADSVSVCLSKALAAPVGSVIVGTQDFIKRARRVRKVLGGGMRQAGVLASCGLVSLKVMSKRLGDDHDNARRFAEGVAAIPAVSIELRNVRSNIVYFQLKSGGAKKTVADLRSRGVLMGAKDDFTIRAVTHYMVTAEGCDRAVSALKELLSRDA